MKLELTTAPASEPVSLSDAEMQVKDAGSTEVSKLTRDISAARERAENWCNRAFINQTWTLKLDCFPLGTIYLPKGKTQQIEENGFTYIDSDDNSTVLVAGTDFYFDNVGDDARLKPIDNWPETFDRPNSVSIEYQAGYGPTLGTEHSAICSAILLDVTDLYENRQTGTMKPITENPAWVSLLSKYVIYSTIYALNDA